MVLSTETPTTAVPASSKTASESGADALTLILTQAGKTAEEIASLSTLDDADRMAENQFSGEAPTLSTLFGTGRARELDAGTFSPSPEVASTMAACIEFLMQRKRGRYSTMKKCSSRMRQDPV